MADFPSANFHMPVISCMAKVALGPPFPLSLGGGSAVWPSANLGLFVPFALQAPYLVRRVWWANGSAVAGTTDVGVYTAGGTLLFSAGATSQAGTLSIQSVALGTPFLMTPGTYYMAMSGSTGTTAAYYRLGPNAIQGQFMGMAQQASAHALPATFTLASYAQSYLPVFGIATANVI